MTCHFWRRFRLRQWWQATSHKDIWATVRCRWGISMPAWRWQQNQPFRCSGGQSGGHRWLRSEEDISLGSLSTLGVRCLEGRPEVANINTMPSVLLSISNLFCGASRGCKYRYNAICFTLNLKPFCGPRARIEFWRLQILHERKFCSLNFRILEFYAKNAKFCTIWKFPTV